MLGDEVSRPGAKAAPPILLPRGPLSFADEDNAHVDEAPTRVADVHMLERQLDEILGVFLLKDTNAILRWVLQIAILLHSS